MEGEGLSRGIKGDVLLDTVHSTVQGDVKELLATTV